MKKKETKPIQYFRLERTDRNMFRVDVITVVDGKIINQELDEPAYLPIAFDKMRRRTADAFFKAVEEENQS